MAPQNDAYVEGHSIAESPSPQIGGGGTYATIGARTWLQAGKLGMIVDRGHDFPEFIQRALGSYGDIWLYRDDPKRRTTRALNSYKGDRRDFQYLTPRVRITPRDLVNTKLAQPEALHFICSPSRAASILKELEELKWSPITIYEPIPDRCVPEELPALERILSRISILSPNAEEALSLLSMPLKITRASIEEAAVQFLNLGIGRTGTGTVIIRSGGLGVYIATHERGGQWIGAFWDEHKSDKVVDVTGAGNSFLGGLAAGLRLTNGDVYQACFYGTVSASFVIEQQGLPGLSGVPGGTSPSEEWNGDTPGRRLYELQSRHQK